MFTFLSLCCQRLVTKTTHGVILRISTPNTRSQCSSSQLASRTTPRKGFSGTSTQPSILFCGPPLELSNHNSVTPIQSAPHSQTYTNRSQLDRLATTPNIRSPKETSHHTDIIHTRHIPAQTHSPVKKIKTTSPQAPPHFRLQLSDDSLSFGRSAIFSHRYTSCNRQIEDSRSRGGSSHGSKICSSLQVFLYYSTHGSFAGLWSGQHQQSTQHAGVARSCCFSP